MAEVSIENPLWIQEKVHQYGKFSLQLYKVDMKFPADNTIRQNRALAAENWRLEG